LGEGKLKKILRLNALKETYSYQNEPEEWKYLGGRSLTSTIISQEVEPWCDPLGNKNKVVMAIGVLGGTPAPCSGRLSIGGKSPLTGTIKEANVGGTAGVRMAAFGLKAIIVEGYRIEDKNQLKVVHISKDGVKFYPAREISEKCNYEAVEVLRQRFGKNSAVIIVGPAGVRGYSNSTIAVTNIEGIPSRHAARGGLGAVLASKGVKAIVLSDEKAEKKDEYSNYDTFRRISREWASKLASSKKILQDYGTANLILPMNDLGCLITRNFSSGTFEYAMDISGEKLRNNCIQRGGKMGHPCHPGCPIRCSTVYMDEKGNYLTSALEYETIGCVGSNCGIGNLDVIARIDRFCDEFGLDTMEIGDTVGVAMESGLIKFGDEEGFLKLLEEIKNDTVLGKVLANGTAVAGKVLGAKRIPVVKNQGLSAYDPRGLKGTGVTYITSPMGADHTAGNVLPGRQGYSQASIHPHESKDQYKLSREIQELTAVCDLTGLCFFVGANLETVDYLTALFKAKFGEEFTRERIIDLGKETIKQEREFNKKAGINEAYDKLPEFFYSEKLPPHDLVFDIPKEESDKVFV
jgi:aldehyde:ferredoxin oxidoreductase